MERRQNRAKRFGFSSPEKSAESTEKTPMDDRDLDSLYKRWRASSENPKQILQTATHLCFSVNIDTITT